MANGLVVNRAVDFVALFAEGFSGAAVGHETFFTQMGYRPPFHIGWSLSRTKGAPIVRNQNVAGALIAWTAPEAPKPLTLMGPTKAPRVCRAGLSFFCTQVGSSIVIFYRPIKIDNGNGFSSVPPL